MSGSMGAGSEAGGRSRLSGVHDRLTGLLGSGVSDAGGAGNDTYWRVFGVALLAITVLALMLAFANFFYAQAAHSDIFSSHPYTVRIDPTAAAYMKPIVDSYMKSHDGASVRLSYGDQADVVISTKQVKGYDSVQVEAVPPLVLTVASREKTVRPSREYWFSYKRTGIVLKVKPEEIASLQDYIASYWETVKPVKLAAVGDIIPGRHVAEQMAKRGVNWPFERIAPVVNGADVSYGDLECPLTDRFPPTYSGMAFSAPTKTINGIKTLGLDLITLANNHSTDFGIPPFNDTIKVLKNNGIKYAGGGSDYNEAHRPAIVEAGGIKFAVLSYNGIEGSTDASDTSPGVAWIGIEPWYRDNPADWRTVESDIRAAKKQADFVIATFHWSKEYQYHPNASMVILAHRACDAGADMVIGQHPHSIQSLESYKGKLIAYSLGNFIFDQRFSEQVRQGVVLKCQLKKGIPISIELVPYRINDKCQTVPVSGTTARKISDKLFQISGWQ